MYVITRMCKRIGACADVCPTDSIHFVENDPEWPYYYIYQETCIDCGACEAECPTEAIFYEDDVPDEYKDDMQKNIDYYEIGPGKDQV